MRIAVSKAMLSRSLLTPGSCVPAPPILVPHLMSMVAGRPFSNQARRCTVVTGMRFLVSKSSKSQLGRPCLATPPLQRQHFRTGSGSSAKWRESALYEDKNFHCDDSERGDRFSTLAAFLSGVVAGQVLFYTCAVLSRAYTESYLDHRQSSGEPREKCLDDPQWKQELDQHVKEVCEQKLRSRNGDVEQQIEKSVKKAIDDRKWKHNLSLNIEEAVQEALKDRKWDTDRQIQENVRKSVEEAVQKAVKDRRWDTDRKVEDAVHKSFSDQFWTGRIDRRVVTACNTKLKDWAWEIDRQVEKTCRKAVANSISEEAKRQQREIGNERSPPAKKLKQD